MKAQDIQSAQFDGLIESQEFTLGQGEVDANLSVELVDEKLAGVQGTARVDDVQIDLASIQQPIRPIDGEFKFSGTEGEIKRLTSGLGDARVNLAGTVKTNSQFDFDQTRVDVVANLEPIQLTTGLNTINTELKQPFIPCPFPVTGEAKAELNVTGTLANPKVAGTFNNTETIRIDQLTFSNIQTSFQATADLDKEFNLKSDPKIIIDQLNIEPSFGGAITGSGAVVLNGFKAAIQPQDSVQSPASTASPTRSTPTPNPQVQTGSPLDSKVNPAVKFDLNVSNLPVEQILQAYGVSTSFQLGELSATAQISGTLDQPQATAEFTLPAASYPMAGTARLTDDQVSATVQIADGVATLRASQTQGIWKGMVQAEDIALAPLVTLGLPLTNLSPTQKTKIAQLDLAGDQLNLQADFSSSLQNFNPNTVTGQGDIQVSLDNRLINIQAQVDQGQLSARFNTDPLPLNRLVDAGLPFANLSPDAVNQVQDLDIRNGSLQAQGTVAGALQTLSPSQVTAAVTSQINLGNAGGQIQADGTLNQGQFQANIDAAGVALNPLIDLGLPYANLAPEVATQIQDLDFSNGRLQGEGFVAGNLANLNRVDGTVQGTINLGNFGGSIQGQGSLNQGQFQAQVNTSAIPLEPLVELGLPLANLSPDLAAEIQDLDLDNGTLQGDITASGSLNNGAPAAITANLNSVINLGNQGGVIKATGETQGDRWKTLISGDAIALERFSELVESQTQDLLDPLRQRGLLAQAENMPLLRGFLNTRLGASGIGLKLNPQTIQAVGRLNLTELPILKQPLESVFNWNGQRIEIEKAETPQIGANGFVTVEFQGTGVPQISNLDLNVRVSDFNLQSPLVQDVLATLPPAVTAGEAPLTGSVSFNGKLTGAPDRLALAGNLELDNFAVRDLEFDPVMAGTITAGVNQGLDLALVGEQDRIELALNNRYLPISFLVKADEAVAQGVPQGENLLVSFSQFPLGVLNLAPLQQNNIGEISGTASGNALVSGLATLAPGQLDPRQIEVRQGELTVEQPTLGYIVAEQLEADFAYVNGIATLDGFLRLPDSECIRDPRAVGSALCSTVPEERSIFRIEGRADVPQLLAELQAGGYNLQEPSTAASTPQTPPPLDVAIAIENGELQDVLTALQWFEIGDIGRGVQTPTYGTAADVQPLAVGLPPEATLLQQLRRLAEIQALLAQQTATDEESPLPPLKALRGEFSGTITASGSIRTGIDGKADITNTNTWTWGTFTAEEFDLEAFLEGNVIRVLPLQMQAGGAIYDFRGQLDLASQRPSGQFRVKNLQLDQLQDNLEEYVDLPDVNLTGELNVDAKIAGTLENPQATGVLTIVDGTVNGEEIPQADGSFTYNNARLSFGGDILLAEADPIQIRGSVPYRLPFAKVAPASDRIQIQLDIRDEGLKVVNLFSPLDLVAGKGLVQLRIGGNLQQTAEGDIAALNLQPQGVFKIQEGKLVTDCAVPLEDPPAPKADCVEQSIVGLSGTAEFLGDRIRVEGIQGSLEGDSGTGKILLQGILPLNQPFLENDPDSLTPLQLSLDNLNVDLKGLYSGNVVGIIRVNGTALEPQIGGLVAVSNGTVLLPTGGGGVGGGSLPGTGPIEPSLNGLQLTLGENTRIRSASPVSGFLDAPLLDFIAQGSITVNGALDSVESIRPQGVVELVSGGVNLYTTRLRLDTGYPQRAIFTPYQGLDPVLDVRLVTRVPETTRFEAPATAFASEQVEASPARFGTVRTIRVTAIVQGPASQINDIIELKSSPPRSETQLVALLGGQCN
ncbi:MAG: DUF490 domain-containing protein [Oscillatoriales cyanobacterium RM1_1_9]|nr:DUF490 domain-containing protein [Oscillatoriales cyanobacterium RM1_1_9]